MSSRAYQHPGQKDNDNTRVTSLANPRVKNVVKLRQRSHRDDAGLMIIEGYRELLRAIDNNHVPETLFVCPDQFLGRNEPELVERCRSAGVEIVQGPAGVLEKMAYRDRPEGLLAVAKQVHLNLEDVDQGPDPLVIVAEAVEKPGNLGTIIRSADAAGADCLVVCDRCTDINNPNVVRASIGTLFTLPVVEASTKDTVSWLRDNNISIVAATPHAETEYYDVDMKGGIAVVMGTEQYGLSEAWLERADIRVRIPMLGQADSLNVASAATILLYEAVRQRGTSTKG